MQNTHVNCKRIYPLTNKTYHNMQKKCNIVFLISRMCRYSPKKHAHDQQKNYMITKIERICRKNAISSSADPRTRRLLTSRFHLCIENLYRIQKFWGHMLRRHSNPTNNKQGLVAPANQAFGRYGFLWFLMSFYRFWSVFYGLWRSCFIKNLVLF